MNEREKNNKISITRAADIVSSKVFRRSAVTVVQSGIGLLALAVAVIAGFYFGARYTLFTISTAAAFLVPAAAAAAAIFVIGLLRTFLYRECAGLPPQTDITQQAHGLVDYSRITQTIWLIVASGFSIFVLVRGLAAPLPAPASGKAIMFFVFVGPVLAFGTYMLRVFIRSEGSKRWPEAPALLLWLFHAQWMILSATLLLLFDASGAWRNTLFMFGGHPWSGMELVAKIWMLFGVFAAVEQLVRAIAALVGKSPGPLAAFSPVNLMLLRWLYERADPVDEVSQAMEMYLGTNLSRARIVQGMKKVIPPAVLFLIMCFAMTDSMVVIHSGERGLRERFGKHDGRIMEPGLHFKWPMPIERIRIFQTEKIRTMSVGFVSNGDIKTFIWTRTHGSSEAFFVVGDGKELISMDTFVRYRIHDLPKWAYGVQNPEEALKAIGYRVLMNDSVRLTLDELLVRDRAEFSRRIRDNMQAMSDELGLGVELVAVDFLGIHPPLMVADAYQRVFSSAITKEAIILKAVADRETLLPLARSRAATKIAASRGQAMRIQAKAEGDAVRFDLLRREASKNIKLFRERKRMDTIGDALYGRRFLIVDDRIKPVETWLEMNVSGRQGAANED